MIYKEKFAPIIDIDAYIASEKEKIKSYEKDELMKIQEEKTRILGGLEEEKREIDTQIESAQRDLLALEEDVTRALNQRDEILGNLESDQVRLKEENEILENQIKYFHESESALLSELGYYERAYDFEEFEKFKNELDKIRDKKKDLLKLDIDDPGSAIYRKGNWNLNLPANQAKSFQKKLSETALLVTALVTP